jgi:hypothetical protein
MTYTAFSVVFGEQPSAAKWNLLGANDAALRDGSGQQWANNQNIQALNASAVAKNMIRLGSDNYMKLSQLPYQQDTTNSTKEDVLFQTGWGFISTGGGGVSQITETVTFPVAFTTLLGIETTTVGLLAGSDPASIIALTATTGGDIISSIYQPTATNFISSLKVAGGTNFAASQRWGYSWLAWGTKSN